MRNPILDQFKSCNEPCWIEPSTKLGHGEAQNIVRSKNFVFFRIIERTPHDFMVMTATAPEDTMEYRQFPHQDLLIQTLAAAASGLGAQVCAKQDREGRPYVELPVKGTHAEITAFVDHVLYWVETKAPLS